MTVIQRGSLGSLKHSVRGGMSGDSRGDNPDAPCIPRMVHMYRRFLVHRTRIRICNFTIFYQYNKV